jgi:hypothetical protein
MSWCALRYPRDIGHTPFATPVLRGSLYGPRLRSRALASYPQHRGSSTLYWSGFSDIHDFNSVSFAINSLSGDVYARTEQAVASFMYIILR